MIKIGSVTNTANGSGEFTEGSAGAGVPPTLIRGAWLNAVQRELVGVVEGAGLTLSQSDDMQVLEAIQKLQTNAIEQATENKADKSDTLAGYGITIASQADAEAADGVPGGPNNTKPMTALRVFQAIAKRITQATESVFGWAKVATQTQTNSGVDDNTFVTPKKFSAGIAALVIQATEAVKGIAKIATLTQVNAGSGDDVIVTPYKMRLGFQLSLNSQGYIVFPTWLGGLIIQWTSSNSLAPGATGAAYWPIAFPVGCIWALAAPLGNSGNGNAGNVVAGGVSPVAVNLYNWGGAITSPARVIGIGV
jgi:hypothetical protein